MTAQWVPDPERGVLQIGDVSMCGVMLSMWDGEYEDTCLLDDGHEGDHFDGSTWFRDGEDVSEEHADDLARGGAVAFAVAFHNARREQARQLSFRTRCADELGVRRPPKYPAWSSLSVEDQRISIRAAREVLPQVLPQVSP